MGAIIGNNNQVTINVTDMVPPDNLATIDKDGKIGNAVSKDKFQESFDAKSMDLDKKIEDIKKQVESNFKGTLKPSSPTPTEDGSYKPEISSELDKPTDPSSTVDWGAKYPNAGDLRAKQGYNTMFYKKGTVWTKSETKIDAATAKQVFDPSDNSSPAVMKATAGYISNPVNIGAIKVGSGSGESIAVLDFNQNGYIDNAGTLINASTHKTTDFIPVPSSFLSVLVDQAAAYSTVLYDASKVFIKTLGGSVAGGIEYNKIFDFDSNVAFIKYIHGVSDINTASVKFLKSNYILPWLKSENTSKLQGKKILWIGTSIPAGYPKQSDLNTWAYPNIIANRNKATIFNKSVPGGVIRKALSNGGSMGGADALSFTNTASAINYQNTIISKIGTSEEPDIIVMDYSVNDYAVDKSDADGYATFDMTSENLNTFLGSYNFVIKKILQAKPGIKLYLICHFSNSSKTTNIPNWINLNNAIVKLGEYWQIPTLKLFNETGWIVRNGVDMLATMAPDNIHPASKSDNSSVQKLADLIENFILTH